MTLIRRPKFKAQSEKVEPRFTKGTRVQYEVEGETRKGTITHIQESGGEVRYLIEQDEYGGDIYRAEKVLTRLADRAQTAKNMSNARTGSNSYDEGKFRPRDTNSKKKRKVHGSPLALIGDIVDKLGAAVLSPDFLIVVLYTLAGCSLTVSAYGWNLLLGTVGGGAVLLGAGMALVEQAIEIYPRLPLYFPEVADKLSYKLGTTKFTNPDSSGNSPSLLDESKHWARNADENLHKLAGVVSNIMYLIAIAAALKSFKVVDYRTWNLDLSGLIWVAIAVGAFELCFFGVRYLKMFKLSYRQSRLYNEAEVRNRTVAEQKMHQAKNN